MALNKSFLIKTLFDDLLNKDEQKVDYAVNNIHKHATESDYVKLTELFTSETWIYRKRGADALIAAGDVVIPVIEKKLDSDIEDVQYWSIKVLGSLGEKGAEALISRYKSISSLAMQIAAINSLCGTADKKTIIFLIDQLKSHHWSVRKAAYDVLNSSESDLLFELIEKAFFSSLQKKSNEDLCFWAIKIMARKFATKGVGTLVKVYEKGNKNLRYYTVIAFGEISDEEAIPHLIRAFSDEVWVIRKQAAEEILKYGRRAIKHLTKAFVKESADIKFWSAWVLSRIMKKSEIIGEFSKVLKMGDEDLKFFAINIIGDTHDEQALKILLPLLKDKSWLIRKQAAENIVKIGKPVLEMIKNDIQSEDEDAAFWSIKIIANLGQSGLEVLKRSLISDSDNQNMKKFILISLSEIDSTPEVDNLIVMAMNDKLWPIRNLAFQMLKNRRNPKIIMNAIVQGGQLESEEFNFWVRKLFSEFMPVSKKILISLINSQTPEAIIFLEKNQDLISGIEITSLRGLLDSNNQRISEVVAKLFKTNMIFLKKYYSEMVVEFSQKGIQNLLELIGSIIGKEEEKLLFEIMNSNHLDRGLRIEAGSILFEELQNRNGEKLILNLINASLEKAYDFDIVEFFVVHLAKIKGVIVNCEKCLKILQNIMKNLPVTSRNKLFKIFKDNLILEDEMYDEFIKNANFKDQKVREIILEKLSEKPDESLIETLLFRFMELPDDYKISVLEKITVSISYKEVEMMIELYEKNESDISDDVVKEFVRIFITFPYYRSIALGIEEIFQMIIPEDRDEFFSNMNFPQDRDYINTLLKVASDNRENSVVIALISVIFNNVKGRTVIEVFKSHMLGEDENMKLLVYNILSKTQSVEYEKMLVEILNGEVGSDSESGDELIKLKILDLLVLRGAVNDTGIIVKLLDNENPNFVAKGIEVLISMNMKSMMPQIEKCFTNSSWVVRQKVVEAISRMSDTCEEDVLVDAVVDENSLIRNKAKKLLKEKLNKDMIKRVIEMNFSSQENDELFEEIRSFLIELGEFAIEMLTGYILDINLKFRERVQDIIVNQRELGIRMLIRNIDTDKWMEFNEAFKIMMRNKPVAKQVLEDMYSGTEDELLRKRINVYLKRIEEESVKKKFVTKPF